MNKHRPWWLTWIIVFCLLQSPVLANTAPGPAAEPLKALNDFGPTDSVVTFSPSVVQTTGVYIEDFTTFIARDYTQSAEWDIGAHALRLARIDGIDQSNPSTAVNAGGDTLIVWYDSRSGERGVYAQKLDEWGNKLWGADVRVDSASGAAYTWSGAVAVDRDGNAVVVWADDRNGNSDIYAQKLDGNGNRLWTADARVDSDGGTAGQYWPAVAVDVGGNAVVVWEDSRNGHDDVYAQKLDGMGNRLWATDTRVNSDSGKTSQWSSAVAVDGNGNAVIVWADGRNGDDDVYAQKLNASGNKVWANDVRVDSVDGTFDQFYPDVAVGGSGNAIVVWRDRRNGTQSIYAQKLNVSGNKLWTADVFVGSAKVTASQYDSTSVSGGGGPMVMPTVSMDKGGNAIIAWNSLSDDIYAQKLDGMGNTLWAAGVRVNADDTIISYSYPAIAIDGNGNMTVVWEDYRNPGGDIYAQRLDKDGNRLWMGDVRANADSGAAIQSTPAAAFCGGGVVVAWQDGRLGNYDIYARKLDVSGNILWAADVRVNSDSGTAGQFDPTLAPDGSGNVIIVWQDGRNGNGDIYAQKLDGSGARQWPAEVRVNSDSGTGGQQYPAIAVDKSGNAIIVWNDDRSGGWDWDVYTQKLDQGGNKLWAADVRINSEIGGVNYWTPASVAVDGGGNIVAVWGDEGSSYHYDVYAQKLNASGSKVWPTDVRLNSDGGTQDQYAPTMAMDSSGNGIVAWQDYRDGHSDIYVQKLGASGDKAWPAEVRANSDGGTASQSAPTLAVDAGGNATVVWGDGRNGNSDVYAQRLSPAGGRYWLNDLPMVIPDLFYLPAGAAQSRAVDSLTGDIRRATLAADYELNGGSVQFYLSNDGGGHWTAVAPGLAHIFTTAGSDLRWRATLAADPLWPRTPVINSLRIEYSTELPGGDAYEPDDACDQARPIAVNGAAQQHTFHQHADEDWVWFETVAGITYTIQAGHTGPRADTVLVLYDACGQPPRQSDDNIFDPGASLTFAAPTSGRYYVLVKQQDPAIYGQGSDYALSARAHLPAGAAVIVAGRLKVNDKVQAIITTTANLAYQTFLQAGFLADNIQYLNSDLSQPGVDALPTKANVRDAVQDWARTRVGLGIPLWFYLVDHGDVDTFYNELNETITAAELNLWLSNLENASGVDQINVIMDACHSGSFIDTQLWRGAGVEKISGHGRVIVASTTYRWLAYAPPNLPGQPIPRMYFSDGFWQALANGHGMWDAFLAGRANVEAAGQRCGDYDYTCQRPWLDDNGDAWFDNSDGTLAQQRGLAASFGSAVAPYIDWVEVEMDNDDPVAVAAHVRDDGRVARVWAQIFAPSFRPPTNTEGVIPVIVVPTRTLSAAGGDVFRAGYDFAEPGVYQVVMYAMDDEGNVASPKWVLVGEKKIYLPLALKNG